MLWELPMSTRTIPLWTSKTLLQLMTPGRGIGIGWLRQCDKTTMNGLILHIEQESGYYHASDPL